MPSSTASSTRPSSLANLSALLIQYTPKQSASSIKSLYGLKQAPRAWYTRFATFLGDLGFTLTRSDNSLFVLRRGQDLVYLLLYVDDIVIMVSSSALLRDIMATINGEFKLKDMGALHYFLGIQVHRSSNDFFLHQHQYALDLLDRTGMIDCRPCSTPIDTAGKLSALCRMPLSDADASSYHSIIGALQYLTMTRPDLQYAVQQACLHMHACSNNKSSILGKKDPPLCSWDVLAWPPSSWVSAARSGCLLGRRLGRLSRHAPIHIWFLCLLRRHHGLLVFQTLEHCVAIERRS